MTFENVNLSNNLSKTLFPTLAASGPVQRLRGFCIVKRACGCFFRQSRVGPPRSDMIDYLIAYHEAVPRYRDRFQTKPSISGQAQVRHGDAKQTEVVRRKAQNDSIYSDRGWLALDLWIMAATIRVATTGFGDR